MLQFGLIGFPLGHSFSEEYFNKKFRAEEIDAHYSNYPIEDLDSLTLLIEKNSISGLNVTIPFKEKILPYLNAMEAHANEVGAVNCIKVEGNKLTGYNTDIIGFERSFLKILPKNRKYKALVFGTGGASRAVTFCLQANNIPYQNVSRNETLNSITYGDLDKNWMNDHNLLINTTPAGMYPDIHTKLPLPYHLVTRNHFAFDLIYNPATTAFLHACEMQHAFVKNGLEMLHIQAEESFRIFMG